MVHPIDSFQMLGRLAFEPSMLVEEVSLVRIVDYGKRTVITKLSIKNNSAKNKIIVNLYDGRLWR